VDYFEQLPISLITVKIGSRIEFLTIAKAVKEEKKF
jgi:hypothetical protein